MKRLVRIAISVACSAVVAGCAATAPLQNNQSDSAPTTLPPATAANPPVQGSCGNVRDCANDALAAAVAAQRAAEQATAKLRATLVSAVVAFNSTTCPAGWKIYEPAQGRFVRGMDKPGGSTDPDGYRMPGTAQEDMVGHHHHSVQNMPKGSYSQGDSGGGDHLGAFTTRDTDEAGGAETRPKNVALLYCILQ